MSAKNNSNNSKDTTTPVPVLETIEVYEPDDIEQEIIEEYGGLDKFISVQLKRKKNGEFVLLHKFNSLPDLAFIINNWQGGLYRVEYWYNPKDPAGNKLQRKHSTTTFFVDGPETYPEPGAFVSKAPAPANNNGNDDFFDKLIKLKAAGLLGDNNKTDASILVEGMKSNTSMVVELIKENRKEAAAPVTQDSTLITLVKPLLEGMIKNGGKSEFEKYIEMDRAVKRLAPAAADDGEFKIKDLLPLVGALVAGMNNQQQAQLPAQTGASNAQRPAVTSGTGGPTNKPGDEMHNIAEALKLMASGIDKLSAKVDKHEEYLQGEDEYNDLPETNESGNNNVINLANELPENEKINGDMEFLENQYRKYAADLKAAPLTEKIKFLNDYLKQGWTMPQIFDWCLKYGAVVNLCEFNDIATAAEYEQLPGDCPETDGTNATII